MKKSEDELIWVVPTNRLAEPLGRPNFLCSRRWQFVAAGDDVATPESLPCMGELFMARSAAEGNEDFLQPIPYVVMVQGGRYLRYRRLKAPAAGAGESVRGEATGGEPRLTGRTSIGAGGHLSVQALELLPQEQRPGGRMIVKQRLNEEIWRELQEEFLFVDASTGRPHSLRGCHLEFRGYLLDRRDAVGRVHLGLVYVLGLPEEVRVDVHPNERHKLKMEEPLEPGQADHELEGWSQLVVARDLVGDRRSVSPSPV